MNSAELEAHLAHFNGSATVIRHSLVRSVLMTEGVVFLAHAAQAHWLMDAIASFVHDPRASAEQFQAWHLSVDAATRRATLAMTDGNSDQPIITQELDYTDFPLDEIAIWLIAEGARWIMMLPSEY
ncbi:MAG: hypothetical protein Q7J52_21940 [Falsiroseomonas sp.]|nr:hypothetical protein [Falsiroseomonas sp.]